MLGFSIFNRLNHGECFFVVIKKINHKGHNATTKGYYSLLFGTKVIRIFGFGKRTFYDSAILVV